MEQRKIMSLGKSSLVISLPKNWLRSNNLSRGDRVSLTIQKDHSLVVHPSLRVRDMKREIHLSVEADESEDSIIRRIIGCHLNSYTDIKLTSVRIFKVGQQKAIRRIASVLYMMIVESEAMSITLRTLIDESKASVIYGIERMHIITSSIFRDILNSMKNWNENIAKSIVPLEDDVDQIMFFILRSIRSAALNPSLANKLNLDPLDCLDYQTLIHRIERITDHVINITNKVIALIESKIIIPDEIIMVLITALDIASVFYDKAVQSFLSMDVASTNEIIDKQKEVEELCKRITPLPLINTSQETRTRSHLISIRESIKKVSLYSTNIAELTVNRTYRTQI